MVHCKQQHLVYNSEVCVTHRMKLLKLPSSSFYILSKSFDLYMEFNELRQKHIFLNDYPLSFKFFSLFKGQVHFPSLYMASVKQLHYPVKSLRSRHNANQNRLIDPVLSVKLQSKKTACTLERVQASLFLLILNEEQLLSYISKLLQKPKNEKQNKMVINEYPNLQQELLPRKLIKNL